MARLQKRDPQEILLDTLKNAIKNGVLKELVLEIAAPCKMQGKRHDGSYRTASMGGGEEFMFSGAYIGKRADRVIFEFKPVDPNGDYVQYELDDTKIFVAFPEIESLVVRSLGFDDRDTDDNPVSFQMVKHQFLKKMEIEEAERAEEEEKAQAKEAATHYEDHPLYGVWG